MATTTYASSALGALGGGGLTSAGWATDYSPLMQQHSHQLQQAYQHEYQHKEYSVSIGVPQLQPSIPKKPDFVPDLRAEIKEWLKDALV